MLIWERNRRTVKGRHAFCKILELNHWKELDAHSFKVCYGHPDYDVVIKFDYTPSHTFTNNGKWGRVDARCDHSYEEWRTWQRASRKVRRYLAPIYFFHRGLIVQRRVEPCLEGYKCTEIADKPIQIVNSSHWCHHTHIPRLMFFDYDNMGYDEFN